MTTPANNQTGNNSRGSEFDKTVILQRCAKHGIPYMENEGCPECAKEKGSSAGKEASPAA